MGNRRVGPISKKAMVYRWCKTYRLKSFSLFNRLSVLFNYFETHNFFIFFQIVIVENLIINRLWTC